MPNSKPLRPSRITLSTGQVIQNHLWPRLTYHIAPCQQRDIELQGCQQQNQGRRRLKGCTPIPPRVQPISTEDIPSNHQPIDQRLRSQSGPKPLEPATMKEQPVAHSTRYQTTQLTLKVQPVLAAQIRYPEKLLNLWCTTKPEEHKSMPVLENETGESLEYSQLRRHPKYKKIWNTSYSNEVGRLCQRCH